MLLMQKKTILLAALYAVTAKQEHICRELVDRFSATSGSLNADVAFALIDLSWFSDLHLNK